MKIHNDNPGATSAAGPLAPANDQATTPGRVQAGAAQTDEVTLSAEAQTLSAIAGRAAEPVAIRQDVVERMRALLDKGAIGDDATRLADAIIDDWLTLP